MTTIPELNSAIAILSKAIRNDDKKLFKTCADTFLTVYDSKRVTSSFMPIILLFSALSYEIANEPVRSRNPYSKLEKCSPIPVGEGLQNERLLQLFNIFLSNFGNRDVNSALETSNAIFKEVKYLNRQDDPRFSDSNDDEVVTFFGILEAIISYLEIIKNQKKSELSEYNQLLLDLKKKLEDNAASPWFALIGRLLIKSLNLAVQRNILHVNLPTAINTELIKNRIVEFWEPQMIAVDNGLLENKNILLTMPTSSGKTFLSTLVSANSTTENKTILIAPTRTLAQETFERVSKFVTSANLRVALSTREKTELDENLDKIQILVATYEKFNSLFRRGLVPRQHIKSLVIDEAHYISDEDRGIQLEFLIKNVKQPSNTKTQIIALSGMVNETDAENLSKWIDGKRIPSDWRPVDLDEMVFFEGNLYHKDNSITLSPFRTIRTLSDEDRRFSLARRIAKEEIENRRQCMIVIQSRSKTEQQAEKIFNEFVEQTTLFQSIGVPSPFEPGRKSFSDQIRNVEPELPPFAELLAKLIKNGIAYHHAGLPEKYRQIVERAVRERAVDVLVTTSTFEAGVNLPVSTIIFPNPKAKLGKYGQHMTLSRYKNIAGRAGRAGYDRSGKSILIALNEEEKEELLENYVRKETDEIKSSIHNFLRSVPTSRYAIQSEILNTLVENRKMSKTQLLESIEDTWFMQTATSDEKGRFRSLFVWELEKLKMYGCIKSSGSDFFIDDMGESARNSMLFAFSVTSIVSNLRNILPLIEDRQKFDVLILSLVSLPWELRSYDDIMDKVQVSDDVNVVSSMIMDLSHIKEKYQRASYAPKFASVLWKWINSIPTDQIIQQCGMKDSHSAFIEETLKEDSYWILKSIANLSNETIKITTSQRTRIKELAEFCKIGSSDPLVRKIMEFGFEHVSRSTALKLVEYFKSQNISTISFTKLKNISLPSFMEIFPNNKKSAEILYDEIHKNQ